MNKNTTWLANAFMWGDEVVDSAQSPAVKLGSTLLPIFAPLVPAFVTALHLHKMYLELVGAGFSVQAGNRIALAGAVITALVLELLGWVGTIAFVKNLFKWVKTKEDEYIIPTVLSLLGYIGYVGDMVMANSARTSPDNVFLLLALLSVPAGFLFAVLFVTGDEDRKEDALRVEQREERLEKYRIKHGAQNRRFASDAPQLKVSKKDWRQLSTDERHEIIHVLSVEEIMSKYPVSRSTAFSWKSKKD